MEKDLDHSLEDEKSQDADENSVKGGMAANSSRRNFTRSAVVGSAVLLTLGNRAAWSQGDEPVACMSTALLLSYRMMGDNFQSAHPQEQERKDQAKDIEKLIKQTNKYYTDDTYEQGKTCVFEKD